ncbi:hypothetical protein KY343_02565 [Candidatus Woesearchaeota archaeon]|nr:hypothetical protein [Candidatus Woesearchaeota archaeon]
MPNAGRYKQSFQSPEVVNNGSTIIYGSGCCFGDGYIITTLFRDDLTGHDKNHPRHLNIQRKIEVVLNTGSEYVVKEVNILNANNTHWLPHMIPW